MSKPKTLAGLLVRCRNHRSYFEMLRDSGEQWAFKVCPKVLDTLRSDVKYAICLDDTLKQPPITVAEINDKKITCVEEALGKEKQLTEWAISLSDPSPPVAPAAPTVTEHVPLNVEPIDMEKLVDETKGAPIRFELINLLWERKVWIDFRQLGEDVWNDEATPDVTIKKMVNSANVTLKKIGARVTIQISNNRAKAVVF